MSLPFYDSSLQTAKRHGPVIPMVDPVTFSKLYVYTFQQLEPFYLQQMSPPGKVSGDKAMGHRDPATGGYLVEWSEPEHIGGGVLQFKRTYAQVPAQRTEYELHTQNYQFIIDGSLTETPMLVNSKVVYDYFHAPKPTTIPIALAPHAFVVGSTIYMSGNFSDLLKPWYLGEDQSLMRWKGFIFYRKSRFVEKRERLNAL